MKITKSQLKQIIKEELGRVLNENMAQEEFDRMLVEGALSDMDDAFRERLSGWVDAAKDLGVSVQDLLSSMSSLPGAAGEAAMQALKWIGKESKYLGQLAARDVVGLDVDVDDPMDP